MEVIRAFQTAALKLGFVDMDECGDGTVIWLKRVATPSAPSAVQRMCIDIVTDSATVYWTNLQGHLKFKTFRRVTALQESIRNSMVFEQLNDAVVESSSPAGLPSVPELSIAAGVGKHAS
jgi:hypothetical protein